MSGLSVAEIWRYPVKSLGGERVNTVVLKEQGIEYDRECAVLDVEMNRLCSLKEPEYRQLGAIAAHITSVVLPNLQLTHPSYGELVVPLKDGLANRHDLKLLTDTVSGFDQGDAAAEYLTGYANLGRELRLVRTAVRHQRRVDPNYLFTEHHAKYSDGYPATLHAEASAQAVAAAMTGEYKAGSKQWRSNFVIRGAEAFDEDFWLRFRIGQATAENAKASSRCAMTELYETEAGVIDRRPGTLKTLKSLGRYGFNGTTDNAKPLFAANIVVLQPGQVGVNDPVLVGVLDHERNWKQVA